SGDDSNLSATNHRELLVSRFEPVKKGGSAGKRLVSEGVLWRLIRCWMRKICRKTPFPGH
ncbi:MAG: hypothetical protein WBD51_16630, partial [Burkholderiaceae bacterium]